jgi:hypothetical protein
MLKSIYSKVSNISVSSLSHVPDSYNQLFSSTAVSSSEISANIYKTTQHIVLDDNNVQCYVNRIHVIGLLS